MTARININGTSGRELVEQWLEVKRKADELMEAIRKASPHPRDYQTHESKREYELDRILVHGFYHEVDRLRKCAEHEAWALQQQIDGDGR